MMADYTLLLKSPILVSSSLFASSLAAAKGTRTIKNLTNDAIGWKRTEKLVGGWWDASFNLTGDDGDLSDRFNSYLGYTVEEIAGVTTWKGLIWKMALSSNGVTREISLDDTYNAVAARFTEHLSNGGFEVAGSGTTFKDWTETTSSGGSIAAESTAANVARGAKSAKLTGKARLEQDVTVKPGRTYRVGFSTRGETFTDVANGDFETDGAGGADVFSGWSESGSVSKETTNINKGTQSALTQNGGILYQTVAVKAKYEYKFSVYSRTRAKVKIANGGFEDGTGSAFTSWTNVAGGGSVAEETTNIAKGSRAVALTDGAYVHQTLTVSEKTEYQLKFYTRGDGSTDGRYSVYDVTNAAYIIQARSTGKTGTKYDSVETKFITPPSCVSVRIQLESKGSSTSYFDVASCEQVTNEASGIVTVYDATNAAYILNAEPTNLVSDRYSRFEYSFTAPPSCTSITISLAAPQSGLVYWDQAKLEYVSGANAARLSVYDNTNSAFILNLARTDHTGDKYGRYEFDFTVPLTCSSVNIRIHGYLDSIVWVDEASMLILSDDEPGDALTDYVTDDRSIFRYGRKEYIVDATAHPQATAEIMRDGVLAVSAWPRIKETAYDIGDIKAPILAVYCLGFIPASNKRLASSVSQGDAADMVQSLVAQSDYLTSGTILINTKAARLNKDRRGNLITEIARLALDVDGVSTISADRDNRLTVANKASGLIPVYYIRRGIISDNRSGTPSSVRHIRPGFLVDLEWRGGRRTTDRTEAIDNSNTGVMASVTIDENGNISIEPVTLSDMETYLKQFDK